MSVAMHNAVDSWTTEGVAADLGVAAWRVRYLMRIGLVAPPPKHGPLYYWSPADRERLRAVLVAEGDLPAGGEGGCGSEIPRGSGSTPPSR
jgi:hypothetical protein